MGGETTLKLKWVGGLAEAEKGGEQEESRGVWSESARERNKDGEGSWGRKATWHREGLSEWLNHTVELGGALQTPTWQTSHKTHPHSPTGDPSRGKPTPMGG